MLSPRIVLAPALTTLTLLAPGGCSSDFESEELATELEEFALEPEDLEALEGLPAADIQIELEEHMNMPEGLSLYTPPNPCDLGLPPYVWADWFNERWVSGTMTGIDSATYTVEVEKTAGLGLSWFELHLDGDYIGYDTNDTIASGPVYLEPGDAVELFINAPGAAPPGWSYALETSLYTHPGHQLVCSHLTTMTIPTGCIGVHAWHASPAPNVTPAGNDCKVGSLPPGAQGFMWGNRWYVVPDASNQCSIGTLDTNGCYVGTAPHNRNGFFANGTMYYNAY